MSERIVNPRVVVTGGAGFIGSHLVEGLLEQGYHPVVLDNFSTGKRENLENLGNGTWKRDRDYELIEGDIRNADTVRLAFEGSQAIFHQAALGSVPRSVEDPLTTHEVNADGTLIVFKTAKDLGIRRVVYASSSSVYGESEVLPRVEGSEGAPVSPYALTKQINEDYGRLFYKLYGLETVGLRYFNIYGPRQDPTSQYAAVIPRFVRALLSGNRPTIYGTGEQSRDFTFVKDVVRANITALNAPAEAAGSAFNIGRGEPCSVNDLLRALQELLGTNIEPEYTPPRAGDVMHSHADMERTNRVLGFSALQSLREGLEDSIEWYKQEAGRR